MTLLEVCVEGTDGLVAAQAGGADRVELCAALSEGGLTPSLGTLEEALGSATIPVHVLVRPRRGDFIYTPHELASMRRDIAHCRELGAAGVVFGALTPARAVDVEALGPLMEAAGELSVTFHRAFDLLADPYSGFDTLAQLHVTRILTSGQARTALEGAGLLQQLATRGRSPLILAGGGVRPHNVAALLAAAAVPEVHCALMETVRSPGQAAPRPLQLGSVPADDTQRQVTSVAQVRAMVAALREAATGLTEPGANSAP